MGGKQGRSFGDKGLTSWRLGRGARVTRQECSGKAHGMRTFRHAHAPKLRLQPGATSRHTWSTWP